MTELEINITERYQGDFELVFGSSHACQVVLEDFADSVSPEHAALKREGDRLFFRDLGSAQGTYINGHKIGRKWHEVTLHDDVHFGDVPFEIDPRVLLGELRQPIIAKNLFLSAKIRSIRNFFKLDEKVLCNNLSFWAQPGTLTAIMGPSGAGKTVLLNLISGYAAPSRGEVKFGQFNVHESFGLVRDMIGYVPQDDIFIPQLTVFQSLDYSLRLRFTDMSFRVRNNLIVDVLKGMGFKGDRLNTLLKSKIGSVESRKLSGGERKRVNIAHELVRNPLVLFLDEPTSGLSSIDAEYVISILKDLSVRNNIPVVTSIHQPSTKVFSQFDNLLLLNYGGNLAYFGAADKAAAYFEELTGIKEEDSNPADYIVRVIEHTDRPVEAPTEIRVAEEKQVGVVPEVTDQKAAEKKNVKKKRKRFPVHQFFSLMVRNLRVKISDKSSLLVTLAQAPIIGFLLVITFTGYMQDYTEVDQYAKLLYYFGEQYDVITGQGGTVTLENLFDASREWADGTTDFFSARTAYTRAGIFFILVTSAIWFGLINSCREVVAERVTLKREIQGYLCVSSYVSAKIVTLAIINLIQVLILLAIATFYILPSINFLSFGFILFVTSLAASSLGLFISAIVNSQQSALAFVPIIIIPQILFGGFVRAGIYLKDIIFDNIHISDFILQKWSFQSLLLCDNSGYKNILIQNIDNFSKEIMKYIRFSTVKISDLFYDVDPLPPDNYLSLFYNHSSVIILIHMLCPLLLTYMYLKLKFD